MLLRWRLTWKQSRQHVTFCCYCPRRAAGCCREALHALQSTRKRSGYPQRPAATRSIPRSRLREDASRMRRSSKPEPRFGITWPREQGSGRKKTTAFTFSIHPKTLKKKLWHSIFQWWKIKGPRVQSNTLFSVLLVLVNFKRSQQL